MKFNVLIKKYLTESQKGSVGGHLSTEEALEKADPQNDIDNFIQTSDPQFLVQLILATRERPEMNVNFKGKQVNGSQLSSLISKTFFDSSSPAYIPLKDKNGVAYNQHQLLTLAKQIGKARRTGDQDTLDYYKDFAKTPQFYVKWEQLLSLIGSVSETDIRQEDEARSRYVTYTNANGEKARYRFHERPDGTITQSPFSSSTQWMKNSIRPENLETITYGSFLKQFRSTDGTLDDLADLIGGTIGQ